MVTIFKPKLRIQTNLDTFLSMSQCMAVNSNWFCEPCEMFGYPTVVINPHVHLLYFSGELIDIYILSSLLSAVNAATLVITNSKDNMELVCLLQLLHLALHILTVTEANGIRLCHKTDTC